LQAGSGVAQLGIDAQALARATHAADKHVAYAELPPHLLEVGGLALVGDGRIAGGDEQPAESGEPGDRVLRQAVREILLLDVTGEIDEGENSDRWPRLSRVLAALACIVERLYRADETVAFALQVRKRRARGPLLFGSHCHGPSPDDSCRRSAESHRQ